MVGPTSLLFFPPLEGDVSLGPYSSMSPLSPTVPSSGPTNVSALATTSSSMLVRWSEIPEADRNGLVLGYKVDAGIQRGWVAPSSLGPPPKVSCLPLDLSLCHRGIGYVPSFPPTSHHSNQEVLLP